MLVKKPEEVMALSLEMRAYAKEKYETFRKIWLQYDFFSIFVAIAVAFWLMVHFLLYGIVEPRAHFIPLTPLSMIGLYLGYNYGPERFYLNNICAIMIIIICFLMVEIDMRVAYKALAVD